MSPKNSNSVFQYRLVSEAEKTGLELLMERNSTNTKNKTPVRRGNEEWKANAKYGRWVKQYLTDNMRCGIMPYRPGDPTVELEAKVVTSTAKAYLIEPTLGHKWEVWLPKSQIVGETQPDDNGLRTFTVTEWWYKKSEIDD